jgi:hypothetical protein
LGKPYTRVEIIFSQKNKNWYIKLADLKVSNKIQLSMIWGVVVLMILYTIMSGVLRAVNVNWNDAGWNVNANSVENPNEWNDGNQVFSRNYCFSPNQLDWEFFVSNPFFQHPSCLPISSKLFNSSVHFSVGIYLFSQAICVKNLRISTLPIALFKKGNLCSFGK